jgi:hypothetical protein
MAKNTIKEKAATTIFRTLKVLNSLFIGGTQVTASADEINIMDGVTKTAAQINALVAGVAGGYKVARGVAAVTGTGTVVTGLSTVVAVIATPASDPDGVALAAVSATIGDQSGAPAAGSVILKCWKVTAVDNATLIAATAAQNVNWIAIGT